MMLSDEGELYYKMIFRVPVERKQERD